MMRHTIPFLLAFILPAAAVAAGVTTPDPLEDGQCQFERVESGALFGTCDEYGDAECTLGDHGVECCTPDACMTVAPPSDDVRAEVERSVGDAGDPAAGLPSCKWSIGHGSAHDGTDWSCYLKCSDGSGAICGSTMVKSKCIVLGPSSKGADPQHYDEPLFCSGEPDAPGPFDITDAAVASAKIDVAVSALVDDNTVDWPSCGWAKGGQSDGLCIYSCDGNTKAACFPKAGMTRCTINGWGPKNEHTFEGEIKC